MSSIAERPVPDAPSPLQWSAIFGGAVAAAGTSLTLNAFGAGIGLSVVSSSPTWRESSAVSWLIAGIFLVFVALVSFAIGGYVAGRMRQRLTLDGDEAKFRDGVHGLVAWGAAAILVAVMALGVAAAAAAGAAQTGTGQSATGEALLGSELDDLFRSQKTVEDIPYRRAEAARILLKSSSRDGVPNTDRRYLTAVTSSITGLQEPDAEDRVNHAVSASKDALHRARVAAVLQAFFVAAALLVGAVAAWFSAEEGGQDRERGTFHFWEWRRPGH